MVLFWKRKKAYIAGLGRDQLEHLASPRQVWDDRKMSWVREYYSPTATYWRFYLSSLLSITSLNQPRCHHKNTFSKILIINIDQNFSISGLRRGKNAYSSFNKTYFSIGQLSLSIYIYIYKYIWLIPDLSVISSWERHINRILLFYFHRTHFKFNIFYVCWS